MLNTKEHEELMNKFENDFKYLEIDRESKEMWRRSILYQNGKTNELFIAYRYGYSFGKSVERQ